MDRHLRRQMDRRLAKSKQKGRMKRIKYEEAFLSVMDQPFLVLDPNIDAQIAARDKAEKEGRLKDYSAPTIKATFAQAIIWFVNNLPFDRDDKGQPTRKLSIEDAGEGYAVIKAFRSHANGFVELEDSSYTWLGKQLELDGVVAFRLTAALVKDRLATLLPSAKEVL